MRKHFLLLFLMAILPLAGWAGIDIKDYSIQISGTGSYIYNGANQVVTLVVRKDNATEPIAATNYDVKYYNAAGTDEVDPKDAGSYMVSAVGKGDYSGETAKISFTITPKTLEAGAGFSVEVTGGGFTYDGTAKTFTSVKLKDNTLVAYLVEGTNKDFTKAYSNNINAGDDQAKITFTGAGNYQGTLEYTFDIAAKPLPAIDVEGAYTFTGTTPTYNALDVTNLPTITVKDGTKTLVEDTDFEVVYNTAVAGTGDEVIPHNAGTYYAIVNGIGNYKNAINSSTLAAADQWKLVVAQKKVMIYVNDKEKIYDGDQIEMNADGTSIVVGENDIVFNGLCTQDAATIKPTIKAHFANVAYNGVLYTAETAATHNAAIDPAPAVTAVTDDLTAAQAAAINTALNLEGDDALEEHDELDAVTLAAYLAAIDYAFEGQGTGEVTSPKDAGSYVMEPFKVSDLIDVNYNPTYMQVGSYTIQKRHVTVTAKNQTFTYTGAVQALTTDDLSDTYVDIEDATATSTTGLVAGDDITTPALFEIVLKEGVVIKEQTNADYTGAILIQATDAADDSNYVIDGVAGNVVMNGKALVLIAGSFNKQYGYAVDFTKDFTVVTNDANVKVKDLKKAPTYTVTKGTETYESGDILPLGTYTIAISNVDEIVPDNYTVAPEDLFTGELIIEPKNLEIVIEDVSLNTGDGQTELRKYASVENYQDELVTIGGKKDVVAFNYIFADGLELDANQKLKAAADYAGVMVDGVITNAVDGELIASTLADPNDNANYNITFVKGGIVLGGAKTLALDRTDANLVGKIQDADAACEASSATKYTVTFGSTSRVLTAHQWYAMVLPFDIEVADLSKALGYAVVDVLDEDANDGDAHLTLYMNEIKANQPFIVKVANDKNLNTVSIANRVIEYVAAPEIKDKGGNSFFGTYTEIIRNFSDKEYYMKEGSFRNSANNVKIQPLGAYIAASTTAARILIEEPDGSTTVINNVTGDQQNFTKDGWYTINGVKLNGIPTEKGIYINNGKKVVLK